MGYNKAIKLRHKEAHKGMVDALAEIITKDFPAYKVVESIAKSVGISNQTVYNYINGKCRDGYVTEAITQECKALKG